MHALALACGDAGHFLAAHALAGREDVELHTVPAAPGKGALAPLLAGLVELDEPRLVVIGDDTDLRAVVVRLLRGNLLARTALAFVPVTRSTIAATWRLPRARDRALEVALTGSPRQVPLLRDDAGGVLLGLGVLTSVRGLAYCDDEQVLYGTAHRIEVRPDDGGGGWDTGGIAVRVIRGRIPPRRARSARGRAFQIGCEPTVPRCDGALRPRSTERWTWYRHTEPLLLVRG